MYGGYGDVYEDVDTCMIICVYVLRFGWEFDLLGFLESFSGLVVS